MADNGIMVSQTKLQQKHSTEKYKNSFRKRKAITIRVSEGQNKKIKELAKIAGQSVTQFMIGRAFEHPNFDREVACGIRNLDWLMNDLGDQEKLIVNKWQAHKDFDPQDIDELFDSIGALHDEYYGLKSALLKTYLTDLEKKKLTEQEKKNQENEHNIRLINLSDKLRGVS